MYPYQLGHNNEEAIESGAFWFYRKLGFRPGRPDLLRLVEREERRIASNPKYRTSARTLRHLAEGHAFYELPGNEFGAWDQFSTRNIGFRMNRRMAGEFGGEMERFKSRAAKNLERILRGSIAGRQGQEYDRAFYDFAMVTALIPELASWSVAEKKHLLDIIRAKLGSDEMRYLHLLQNHARLRAALLRLGSRP